MFLYVNKEQPCNVQYRGNTLRMAVS